MRKLAIMFSLLVLTSGVSIADIIPSTRTITWQGKVGVEGGIPNRTTICATISGATYGNDSTDATSAINNAISGCPSGQVVYLPAGTYRTSGAINLKSGVTLRGAGPGPTGTVTKINFRGSLSSNSGMIRIVGSANTGGSGIAITSGNTKGSTTITLSNGSSFSVGDYVSLDQLNNGDWITSDGLGSFCTWCGRSNGNRSMGQISRVTGKPSTNVLTIEPGLNLALESDRSPQALRLGSSSDFISGAGLEDLQVEIKSSGGEPFTNIWMFAAVGSWVKNIYSPMGAGRSHMEINWSYRNEVRDSWTANGRNPGSVQNYGIECVYFSTGNLFENNIMEHTNTGYDAAWGASGNVFAYSYTVNGYNYGMTTLTAYSAFPHGAHSSMNLFEGNDILKFYSDWYWGTSSHHTVFRNNISGYDPSHTYSSGVNPISIERKSYYSNIVGNILGGPQRSWNYESNGGSCGSGTPTIYMLGYSDEWCGGPHDSGTKSTLLRHGNYDYASTSTKWCDGTGETGCQGGDASHTIPSSLYLSGKPSWWCDETPWPPIGSDLSPMVSSIPAKRRYEGLSCGGGGQKFTPNPPSSLIIN